MHVYSYCLCTQRMIFQSWRLIIWQCYYSSQAKNKPNQAATIQKLAVKKKKNNTVFFKTNCWQKIRCIHCLTHTLNALNSWGCRVIDFSARCDIKPYSATLPTRDLHKMGLRCSCLLTRPQRNPNLKFCWTTSCSLQLPLQNFEIGFRMAFPMRRTRCDFYCTQPALECQVIL